MNKKIKKYLDSLMPSKEIITFTKCNKKENTTIISILIYDFLYGLCERELNNPERSMYSSCELPQITKSFICKDFIFEYTKIIDFTRQLKEDLDHINRMIYYKYLKYSKDVSFFYNDDMAYLMWAILDVQKYLENNIEKNI